MQKFKVQAWHDYHGDPVVFLVVDAIGDVCGRFASEWEAEKSAAERNNPKPSDTEKAA